MSRMLQQPAWRSRRGCSSMRRRVTRPINARLFPSGQDSVPFSRIPSVSQLMDWLPRLAECIRMHKMSGTAGGFHRLRTIVRNTLPPTCPMSSSSSPEHTWHALIEPFRQRLDTYRQTPISNEEGFRAALISLCEQYREWQSQRLITRIRKQHSSIIDLARGIDSALNTRAPAEFTALIWKTAYTAIRVSTITA
jgi:hypothetical protein